MAVVLLALQSEKILTLTRCQCMGVAVELELIYTCYFLKLSLVYSLYDLFFHVFFTQGMLCSNDFSFQYRDLCNNYSSEHKSRIVTKFHHYIQDVPDINSSDFLFTIV